MQNTNFANCANFPPYAGAQRSHMRTYRVLNLLPCHMLYECVRAAHHNVLKVMLAYV